MSDAPHDDRPTEVRIRRAPKLGVFLALGAFAGALVTLIVTSQYKADPAVGYPATVGYFLLYGVPAGLVLGALVGLILDAVSRRRARTVTVSHEVVAEPDVAGDTDTDTGTDTGTGADAEPQPESPRD